MIVRDFENNINSALFCVMPSEGLNTWDSGIVVLRNHCDNFGLWLSDELSVLDEILQYLPKDWLKENKFREILQKKMRHLWYTITRSSGATALISDELEVQAKWYYALNCHAEKIVCYANSLFRAQQQRSLN